MNLGEIRDFQKNILSLPSSDPHIDSQLQLDFINEGYRLTAYRYDWPEMYKRFADVIVADKDRYALQSDFRKFDFLYVRGTLYVPTDLKSVKYTSRKYAVDKNANDYILSDRPSTAPTAYTTQNNETAGNSVTVELDTVSGLSAGDEIWINSSSTPEFTVVESVDSDNTTITISFKNDITAGDIIYLAREINYFGYYVTVTDLSDSSDTPILPSAVHQAIGYYAVGAYIDGVLEDSKRAQVYFNRWEKKVKEVFLGFDQLHTGQSNEFSI